MQAMIPMHPPYSSFACLATLIGATFLAWAPGLCLADDDTSESRGATDTAKAAGTLTPPFLLWSDADVKALRTLHKNEAWMKAAVKRMMAGDPGPDTRSTAVNLFLYRVMDDRSGVAVEREALTAFIGAPPFVQDPTDWRWHHVDHYEMVLRYDTLYDQLTAGERRALEATFRRLAVFGIEQERIREWENYPRFASHSLCALATRDKRLIKAIFECKGGLKSYLDSLLDGHFSRRMGNPDPKLLGQLMLWCRGVKRLGMNELGFGYKSKSGGSVRSMLEGIVLMGDPVTVVPGATPFYGRSAVSLTIGNNRFQHKWAPMERLPRVFPAPIVVPHTAQGGGWERWSDQTGEKTYDIYMKGRLRMMLPGVFELAHLEWPDAGFDYFLAQMKHPGDEHYLPSPFWGVRPIDSKKVTPPAMKSAVYDERGVALLRARGGRDYWESPKPMAVLQMAMGTGRDAQGSVLSLHHLHAFNRPLYAPLSGFDRHSPWEGSAKRHATVLVDHLHREKRAVDDHYEMVSVWPRATGHVITRKHFNAHAQFVSVRVPQRMIEQRDEDGKATRVERAVYPGTTAERCLVLTDEYLFDVFAIDSDKPRTFRWFIHALGQAQADKAWKPTSRLDEALGAKGRNEYFPVRFEDVHTPGTTSDGWSIVVRQDCHLDDVSRSLLGKDWYDRKIGVRLSMLGGEATVPHHAVRPRRRELTDAEKEELESIKHPHRLQERDQDYNKQDKSVTEIEILPLDAEEPKAKKGAEKTLDDFKPRGQITRGLTEVGGATIIVERQGKSTTFIALHEPFEHGSWKIDRFDRLAEKDDAMVIAIGSSRDKAIDDRVMIRIGEQADKAITLEAKGERFTFVGYGYIRIGADHVSVSGDVRSLKLRVNGSPKLVINDKVVNATYAAGFLEFGGGE